MHDHVANFYNMIFSYKLTPDSNTHIIALAFCRLIIIQDHKILFNHIISSYKVLIGDYHAL